MNVRLERTCPLPCTPEVAWAFLQDVEALAACMPGARITERLEPGRYKGTVTVKVGPATLAFRGELAVQDVEPASRSLRLVGKGTDTTGGSGASMNLAARIEPAEGGLSTLAGTSDVSMSGKAAAFGGRMVNGVADQILKQFADNVAARVATLQPPAEAAPSPVTYPPSGSASSDSASSATPGSSARPAAPMPAAPRTGDAPRAEAPPQAHELDGLALAWAAFKSWLRSLFGKNPA